MSEFDDMGAAGAGEPVLPSSQLFDTLVNIFDFAIATMPLLSAMHACLKATGLAVL